MNLVQHLFRNICGCNFLIRHAEDSHSPSGKSVQSGLRLAEDVPGLRLHHASFNSDLRAMWQTAACHPVVTL